MTHLSMTFENLQPGCSREWSGVCKPPIHCSPVPTSLQTSSQRTGWSRTASPSWSGHLLSSIFDPPRRPPPLPAKHVLRPDWVSGEGEPSDQLCSSPLPPTPSPGLYAGLSSYVLLFCAWDVYVKSHFRSFLMETIQVSPRPHRTSTSLFLSSLALTPGGR